MSITINWTKSWSSSDDGTYLHGADLANIQADLVTALLTALSSSANNTYTGIQTFNAAATFASTAAFTGAVTMASTLAVTGNTTVTGNLAVTGTATITSTSTFTGKSTFNGGTDKSVVVVTDQVAPVFDASVGDIYTLSMGADRTLATPTNYPASGTKEILLRVYASGAARTLTLPVATTGDFTVGAITITQTVSGKYDYIRCQWNATTSRWDVVSYAKGY